MAQQFVLSTLNAPTAAQRLNPSAEIVGDGNTPAAAAPFSSQILFNFTGIGQYFLLFWIDEIGLVNLHKLL